MPLRWREPRTIFVNSMSDLFHEKVPARRDSKDLRDDERGLLAYIPGPHKASDGAAPHAEALIWTPNIWMGVTVESYRYIHRIEALRMVPAKVRFVSFEPLLSPIPMATSLEGIHWAIIGGESGPGARPMDPKWATDLASFAASTRQRSSSSSGAASGRRLQAASSTGGPTTRCHLSPLSDAESGDKSRPCCPVATDSPCPHVTSSANKPAVS